MVWCNLEGPEKWVANPSCVDVPAQLPILRLMQHVASDRVHVLCGAVPSGAILSSLATREAVRARPRHHEQGVGCRYWTNEQHQKQLAREGRAEHEVR